MLDQRVNLEELTTKNLDTGYVYYRSLEEYDPKSLQYRIGAIAKNELGKYSDPKTSYKDPVVAQTLHKMAANERKKDLSLLENEFGITNLPLDGDFYPQFIHAINTAISTEAAYKRFVERIEKQSGIITPAALFPEYFSDFVNSAEGQALIQQAFDGFMQDDNAEEFSNKLGRELVRGALRRILNSKDFNGNGDDIPTGLKDFLDALDETKAKDQGAAGNQLIDDIIAKYTPYRDWMEKIMESLDDMKREAQNGPTKFKLKLDIPQKDYKAGGSLGEMMGTFYAQVAANDLEEKGHKHSKHRAQARQVGLHGMKTDFMMSFGLDIDATDEFFHMGNPISRLNNELAMNEMSKSLRGDPHSYLVLMNAKDYVVGKYFQGFSAGTAQTLKNFKATYQKTRNPRNGYYGNIRELVGAIANTIKGALGDQNQENIELTLATDIASFLFDDFVTIGQETTEGHPNQLHLMYLDGIYVPLCYILDTLANALDAESSSADDIRQIASVTIKYGSKTQETLYEKPNDTGAERWRIQREAALQDIEISARFLNNFEALVQKLSKELHS